MNASEGLWRQWSAHLRAFLPEAQGRRSKTLAFFVLGVVLAGTTRLPRVAEALVGVSAAKTPSSERRLSRFLAKQQIAVVPLWTHLLGQFLRFWRDRRLVFAWSSPGFRARRDGAGRPRERAVFRPAGPFAPRAGQLAGAARARAMGEQGNSGSGRWSACCSTASLHTSAPPSARCWPILADRGLVGHPLVHLCAQRGWHDVLRLSAAHTCQPTRGRCAQRWIPVDSVSTPRAPARTPVVRLGTARYSSGRRVPCLPRSAPPGSRSSGNLGSSLRPARRTAPGARVRAPHAGRIDLPRPQTPRLGPGRDRHGGPSAPRPSAPGAVGEPLVAGASGGGVRASRTACPVRSPRSPRQGHLSARTALVARDAAANGDRNASATLLAFPHNPHGMGVLPPLLKSVRERGGELPRRAQDAKQTPARVDMATIRKAMRRGRWRMGNLLNRCRAARAPFMLGDKEVQYR
jgi:hypothetical protein